MARRSGQGMKPLAARACARPLLAPSTMALLEQPNHARCAIQRPDPPFSTERARSRSWAGYRPATLPLDSLVGSLAARPIASLCPGCEKAASSGNGTRAMPHRPSFSAPDDGFGGKLPIFPLGTLKLGDLRLRLGIPEAEVTDEVPVGRDSKNFGHPCGSKDGNPAEANPLRTGS